MLDLSPTINNVSIGLYSGATSLVPTGNFLVSPISILYSMVLVYLGARGTTRDNLYKALDFREFSRSGADQDVAGAFGQLMGELKVKTNPPKSSGKNKGRSGKVPGETAADDPFQLALANGVFLRKDIRFDENYLSMVNRQLKSSVQTKDFENDPEQARADINKWIEERTGGEIKDLIPPDILDENTMAVLANAVYFNAQWDTVFRPEAVEQNAVFHLLNGKKAKVAMMTLDDVFDYAEDNRLKMKYLEIPYINNEASMLIFLPNKKTGLRDLEKALTVDVIQQLDKTKQRQTLVQLRLPKFKMESSFDMVALLKKIGVKTVFTREANLTGMVPHGSVHVDSGFHKTFIDVNEKGTRAAAASAAVLSSRSLLEPEYKEFFADHPFLFAIRHNRSKAILFIGRFESPESATGSS